MVSASTILLNIVECPCKSKGSIIDIVRAFSLREKTIVYSYDSKSLSAESLHDILVSTLESTAMVPYKSSKALICIRVINIKLGVR